MNATQQFIEDAIKGGWGSGRTFDFDCIKRGFIEDVVLVCETDDELTEREPVAVEVVLLDPLAWQAVGKTRGWDDLYFLDWWNSDFNVKEADSRKHQLHQWHLKQFLFTCHLADGLSIEEALSKLA